MPNKNYIKYQLVPQAKFYDSMTADWKPFVMFNQFPSLRSRYCNTDMFGLRYNNFNDEKNFSNSIFEQNIDPNKKNAVLIGNSIAFGEGTTSDSKTISSYLSQESDYNFLNLGGRGFSGYQEIIIFLSHLKRIKNLTKVVIISGFVDLLLIRYIKNYDETFGPFFSYNLFLEKMQGTTEWKNKLFKLLFGKFFNPNINWSRINLLNWHNELFKKKHEKLKETSDNDKNLENLIDRNLMIWSIISQGMNLNIDYMLQPVPAWYEKTLSKEEKEIFNESDKSEDLRKVTECTDLKKYKILQKILQNSTKKHNINFIDCNEIFKKKSDKDWMYIDKVHLNDTGYRRVANELLKNLS